MWTDRLNSRYQAIYAVVRKIPHGYIATYGQVARLAGYAGQARQVGYALHALPDGHDLPWHRVINARGEISKRSEPALEDFQRELLQQEGISFDERFRVSLARYQWHSDNGL